MSASLLSKAKEVNYFSYIGIIGGIFVILSEFLSWFSDNNLILIYFLSPFDPDAFVYFFPLMSGIICLFGSFLYTFRQDLKINSIIIQLIGLGFNTIFILDFIVNQIAFILTIQLGFYFFIVGFSLIFIEIIVKLTWKEEIPVNQIKVKNNTQIEE